MTLNISFTYPVFPDQTFPNGELVDDKRCQACWWYYVLASKNRDQVGKGIESQIIVIEDGDPLAKWMDRQYEQIARSVAKLYGLESPDDFLRFMPQVEKEARRFGIEARGEPFIVADDIKHPLGVKRFDVPS